MNELAPSSTKDESNPMIVPQPSWSQRAEPYYFIVEGWGAFPEDMLRYDQAWITTAPNIERGNASEHQRKKRLVLVACWRPKLTGLRWSSFGWAVLERFDKRPEPPFRAEV